MKLAGANPLGHFGYWAAATVSVVMGWTLYDATVGMREASLRVDRTLQAIARQYAQTPGHFGVVRVWRPKQPRNTASDDGMQTARVMKAGKPVVVTSSGNSTVR